MSFRLRVLALVVLVTLVATAATAWLTLRTVAREIEQSVTAGQEDIRLITTELVRYGRDKDTWDGVDRLVAELAGRTGQRIWVVGESGREIADSDVLAGGPARPVAGAPLIADARPVLPLRDSIAGGGAVKLAASAISMYHRQRKLKKCYLDAGVPTVISVGQFGLEELQPVKPFPTKRGEPQLCERESEVPEKDFEAFLGAVQPCETLTNVAMRDCLQTAFLRQISPVAPEPLRVYIGASDDRPATPPVGPVAAAAGLVAAIAIAGSLLLSRRVLRPVRALTAAADRLGQGRLADRVPVSGRDEIAALSRSFNRMAQALQDSEERQRRMTADVAHELRTPLTNLRGYLEALTDGTAEPSRELFWSLREEALLQQRIIDDLQDLALAEAGRLSYRRVPVDLAELVESYARQHFSDDIDIAVRAGQRPAYVDGDPDRLRQAVNNLVRNALTACRPGGTVTLTVVHSGPWVELSVSDTGAGIAPEDLPHVFERFWRADRARQRPMATDVSPRPPVRSGRPQGGVASSDARQAVGGSGVGLGLAIVRQIVHDHAGTIAVSSPPGHGATFTLRLPAHHGAGGPT
ncbi:sensor histidine kinase [Allorhizocola rhizosphaerae]|uniref:sensor histidine kinase n=1 Tax=Allorhizocola rhizosphaerae TaxID=1872709 RepID=UPI000E3E129A|nr:HAMP domain-containing sensor histidine kinase [Allorhizocola rhizosphaerae]